MKVYVITLGCYSDYHICSVTLDKEQAEMLREKYSSEYDSAEIETYDTDDNNLILKCGNVYSCWYLKEDSQIIINPSTFSYFRPEDLEVCTARAGYRTHVLADSEEDALKIASDKFAKYRAEKMGL